MDCALPTTWIDLLASPGKHPIVIDSPRCSVHLADIVITLHELLFEKSKIEMTWNPFYRQLPQQTIDGWS